MISALLVAGVVAGFLTGYLIDVIRTKPKAGKVLLPAFGLVLFLVLTACAVYSLWGVQPQVAQSIGALSLGAAIAGLLAGYVIYMVRHWAAPALSRNPGDAMQPRRASFLTAYLIFSTAVTAYGVLTLWDAQPPAKDEPPKRAPSCSEPAKLQLVDLDPDTVPAGFSPNEVTLLGCGFTTQTQARLNGVVQPATYLSANKISITLSSADVNTPRLIAVGVSETAPAPPVAGAVATGAGTGAATEKSLRVTQAMVVWIIGTWPMADLTTEVQLILLVLITGAFGSSVYGLKSIADFLGDKELYESWFTYYLVQPWEGAGIAFLFYLVMRGGLLQGTGADIKSINSYGITAVAALVGAFSDKALGKLRDVAEALFFPKDTRGDKGTELKITTSSPLRNAQNGALYHVIFQAANGTKPYTWSKVGTDPAWLPLNPVGIVSGTAPTMPQACVIHIQVTDKVGDTAIASFDLKVV